MEYARESPAVPTVRFDVPTALRLSRHTCRTMHKGGSVAPGLEPAADGSTRTATRIHVRTISRFDDDLEGGADFEEHETGTSVFHALLWIVPGLYIVWYVLALILLAVLGQGSSITFTEPFDHNAFTPAVTADRRPLVNWLSMLLSTTVAGPWLVYFAIREARRATDCAIAVGSLHFFLSTTVTRQTPENWVWFATFMPCMLFMGRMAEFMLARFERRRYRESMVYPPL